jgi:hypothetical protein
MRRHLKHLAMCAPMPARRLRPDDGVMMAAMGMFATRRHGGR